MLTAALPRALVSARACCTWPDPANVGTAVELSSSLPGALARSVNEIKAGADDGVCIEPVVPVDAGEVAGRAEPVHGVCTSLVKSYLRSTQNR